MIERVARGAERLGFRFPIALDADWKALDRWWLDEGTRAWTSVSFLIDKQGTIRYIHPGGEFHEGSGGDHWADHATCRRQYKEIDETIARLLME